MIQLLKKPLFWTNIFALVFAGWLIASLVLGWNNPVVPPPDGSAAITVDASRNVGIGALPDASAKLKISGNVSWTGALVAGSVPWPRLTSLPSDCAGGQFVTGLNSSSLDCASPSGGAIGGSGTTNFISKFTAATTLGNSQIFDNGTNVGIGNTAPGTKLDVTGNINAGDLWRQGVSINTPGTINLVSNPLEWTRLKNVPPGISDGVDNTSACVIVAAAANSAVAVPSQCLDSICTAVFVPNTGTGYAMANIYQRSSDNRVVGWASEPDSFGDFIDFGVNGSSDGVAILMRSTSAVTILQEDSSSELTSNQWFVGPGGPGSFVFCN
ncbi:MAG: hypothetical protein HYT03_00755 [Candidatus Harrisonbacteria bacterium]|nr:hypothetical protein [Candidatus Harrisonbacteria bacterium]